MDMLEAEARAPARLIVDVTVNGLLDSEAGISESAAIECAIAEAKLLFLNARWESMRVVPRGIDVTVVLMRTDQGGSDGGSGVRAARSVGLRGDSRGAMGGAQAWSPDPHACGRG